MGFVILLILLFYTIYLDTRNKSSVVPILLMTILSPEIRIVSIGIDSLYIFEFLLFLYICVIKKVLIIGAVKRYTKIVVLCLSIYTISWVLFSRIGFNSLISCLAGGLKISIALVECWTLNSTFKKQIESDIFNLVIVVLIVNATFVTFQSIFYEPSLWMLKNVFLSSSEYEYALSATYAGHYTRYGGLFKYPMHMGVFCVIAIAFLLSIKKRTNSTLNNLAITLSAYCGIMSSTKSFFIGIAVIYCFYVIQKCISIKNKKDLVYCLFPLFVVIMVVVFQNQIIQLIENIFGSYAAFYAKKIVEFFNNAESVFDTRLGEAGAIASLRDVVKENVLFGVGPASVNGEKVMDNAILVVLHNGGIFALFTTFYYYFETAKVFFKSKMSILVILAIIACGMGFQIWIASPLTAWACYYFDIEVNNLRKRKS